jgi:hypothetical protein
LETGWNTFYPDVIVRDSRRIEAFKTAAIKSRGYDLLIVWDFEFLKDPKTCIAKCEDFLLS